MNISPLAAAAATALLGLWLAAAQQPSSRDKPPQPCVPVPEGLTVRLDGADVGHEHELNIITGPGMVVSATNLDGRVNLQLSWSSLTPPVKRQTEPGHPVPSHGRRK